MRLGQLAVLLFALAVTRCPGQDIGSGWDLTALNTGVNVPYLTDAEKEVILLLNEVRTNPKKFADDYLKDRQGRSAEAKECYRELLATSPRPALLPSKALSFSARDHATDMGKTGKTGHVSSDGATATQRVERYGKFIGMYDGPWENCSYGFDDPLEIVLQLLVDENVPGRGHRKNILEPHVHFVGVSIQPHESYRFNCVMDFADAIQDN
jgi:Cysteine-rich secretory protein family